MPATAFDTLQFAEGLKVAGTPAPQADATARLLADALSGCVGELATHAHLREGFASVEHRLDAGEHRLDAVEHRLDAVEHRLDAVEHRLDAVEHRLDAVEHRLDAVEHRLDAVEHRLDAVEHRLDAVEHRLDAVEHRLDAVEHRLDAVEQGLARCVLALHGQARDLAWLKRGNLLVLASLFPLLFKAFV